MIVYFFNLIILEWFKIGIEFKEMVINYNKIDKVFCV